MKKILISGGWGYGNLGDEAILVATLKMIYNIIPDAEITILSPNPIDTYYNLNPYFDKINVIPSFHSLLFRLEGFRLLTPWTENKIVNIIYKINRRLGILKKKIISQIYYKNHIRILDYISTKYNHIYDPLFSESDLLILSGGGYLNNWYDKLISHYIEVKYADKNNLNYCLIGQTLGPFSEISTKKWVEEILQNSKYTIFRDKDSFKDFPKIFDYSSNYNNIPDIALSDYEISSNQSTICFIPFSNKIAQNANKIANNLIYLQKKTGLKIVLTISQTWSTGHDINTQLYKLLKTKSANVIHIIPNNVKELQTILSSSVLTISENLHGLILAYRSGAKVISLNKGRKFVSFMKMIDNYECICDPYMMDKEDTLYNKYIGFNKDNKKLENFKEQIKNEFQYILNVSN